MIAVPKAQRTEGHREFDMGGDIKYYLKHYDINKTNEKRWTWQAVVLMPGMEL
jgi:hypothetical protein